MCGIVGYIGPRQAAPILVNGLKRLEYRGYDSAGLAILDDGKLRIRKTVGKLRVLEQSVLQDPMPGTPGIGHTRWATHGKPSEVNAHPHVDCSGRIALVHNGIIENFLELRQRLIAEGHVFKSDTDTEVIVHLVESHYRGDLAQAVRDAAAQLDGAYAICALCQDEPDRLVAARYFSPLILGIGEGENFVGSDIPALLDQTREVFVINDGEMGVLTAEDIELYTIDGKPITREVFHVEWDAEMAEKGGYKHFMLKEIHEQPEAMRNALRGRISEREDVVKLPELEPLRERLLEVNKVFVTACGTAYYAGLVGKLLFETLARLPVESELASEFRYRDIVIEPNQLTVTVSQSGETADTLAALRASREAGSPVVSVVNVVGSSVARESDCVLYINAGPEIGVASTKAYTCQSIVLSMLALELARLRGTIDEEFYAQLVRELRAIPDKAARILSDTKNIEECAKKYHVYNNFLYLGRGMNLPSAYEGALKLKEISYIHAEGYAAGEMKHGPIALIEPACPTVAIAIEGRVYDKMISNIQEVRARDGEVIAVAFEGDHEIERHANWVLRVPRCHELVSPLLVAIPLQLFAYYCADLRGCDIDQPRNLAKSVTVE